MNTELLLVSEFIDIKIAIKANITECDKRIEECQKLNVNSELWDIKKVNLTNALSKLESKFNSFTL